MEDTAVVTAAEFFTGAFVHPKGNNEINTAAHKKYFFTALLFANISFLRLQYTHRFQEHFSDY